MSISMKAIKPHVYAGKRIAAGQVYEVRGQSDARIMKALGRSADHAEEVRPEAGPRQVEPVAPPVTSTYSTAAIRPSEALMDLLPSRVVPGDGEHKPAGFAEGGMTADVPSFPDGGLVQAASLDSTDVPRVKRAYRRRDMKAEE